MKVRSIANKKRRFIEFGSEEERTYNGPVTEVERRCVYLLPNKSFIPSMSNVREKRSVWSRGLLFAVAIT